MAKTNNIERSEWRARCRVKLAEHISMFSIKYHVTIEAYWW